MALTETLPSLQFRLTCAPEFPMSTVMAKRPRMFFDCDERYRRAIRIKAAKLGKPTSEVIQAMLDEYIPEELAEADALLADKPAAKRKRE